MSYWDYEMDAQDYEDYHQSSLGPEADSKYKRGNNMAVVKCNVMWAHVQAPDDYDKYSVCGYISKELAKELTDQGATGIRKDKAGKVEKDENGNIMWQFRTNALDKEGNKKEPLRVVDKGKNPFTKLVGNGSLCNIQYTISEWEFKGKKGIGSYLNAVQVLDHVAFGGAEDEFEDEDPEAPKVDEFDEENLFD